MVIFWWNMFLSNEYTNMLGQGLQWSHITFWVKDQFINLEQDDGKSQGIKRTDSITMLIRENI